MLAGAVFCQWRRVPAGWSAPWGQREQPLELLELRCTAVDGQSVLDRVSSGQPSAAPPEEGPAVARNHDVRCRGRPVACVEVPVFHGRVDDFVVDPELIDARWSGCCGRVELRAQCQDEPVQVVRVVGGRISE